ncbi:hypothetical protein FA95DRAFT_1564961 [Auriscalpium vulgare]|uniref:Uncharacterized protein n=1 Tax=Auriscalpium vulgare TaxID=40419 RepID=A0ACB8RCE6_9AGAM|nr:hypothetical protein FA95DRAFT_1564961 [Auriscalpium vulgare]
MSDSDSDSSASTVIQIPPHLFLPQDGRRDLIYTREDHDLFFLQQQPLSVLPHYLWDNVKSPITPPVLHLGWMLDDDAVMQYTQLHLPHMVLCTTTGSEPPTPSPYRTLCGVSWAEALFKHLGLPRFPKDAVRVVPMSDDKGKAAFGLSLGTNHRGIVPEKYHARLQEAIAKDQPLRWYLDYLHWQWAPRRANGRLVAARVSTSTSRPRPLR